MRRETLCGTRERKRDALRDIALPKPRYSPSNIFCSVVLHCEIKNFAYWTHRLSYSKTAWKKSSSHQEESGESSVLRPQLGKFPRLRNDVARVGRHLQPIIEYPVSSSTHLSVKTHSICVMILDWTLHILRSSHEKLATVKKSLIIWWTGSPIQRREIRSASRRCVGWRNLLLTLWAEVGRGSMASCDWCTAFIVTWHPTLSVVKLFCLLFN